jgi:hypothetical protein
MKRRRSACFSGWRRYSRYRDSLRAGQSGDRISIAASSSAPRLDKLPGQWVLGIKRLERGAVHPPTCGAGCEWVGTVPPLPLYVCIGMPWGDLYLYL